MTSSIDWPALRRAALEAMGHAYAPYSRYPVGAAALVEDGRIVTGCNVENASYGLGLCAECGMVSELARSGGGRLVAVACVGGDGQPLMPCGRCRQLLYENGGPEMELMTGSGVRRMDEVLPDAFGPDNLA
jgi:cytidine deaminase